MTVVTVATPSLPVLSITAWLVCAVVAGLVGLAAVSSVRESVTDAPAGSLSGADIQRILDRPEDVLDTVQSFEVSPAHAG